MKFAINDDQRALRDSVQSWLAKEYTHAVWRDVAYGARAGGPAFWQDFAAMGWLAAPLSPDLGGLGGGTADAAVLAEAFGSALVLEPLLSTVVLGAGLIRAAGSTAQQAEWLPQVAEGRLRLAFAQAEAQSGFALNDVQTCATRCGGAWSITGEKMSVWDAPDADWLIVLARTSGARMDTGGLGLFLVPRKAAGVTLRSFPMLDKRPGAHVRFDAAQAVAVLGDPEGVWPAVRHTADQALAVLASEACGAMDTAVSQTAAYLQQRKQFGQALSGFQVLRHRVVDMRVQLECSRSVALHAALCADDPATAPRACASAKVQAGRAGRWIGHQAIQLHGGMGMTDELAIGHYMKRLLMLDTFFGNADHHQQRLAAPEAATA